MIESLISLFQRDLDKLKTEIELFKDESNLWETTGDVKNSSGNLAIHISGNLQHFIGAVLGKTDYIRDREFEFAGKNVSKSEIINQIDAARNIVAKTLNTLTTDDLTSRYPIDVFQDQASTEKFMLHLYGHMMWHLGQINYLRRILES